MWESEREERIEFPEYAIKMVGCFPSSVFSYKLHSNPHLFFRFLLLFSFYYFSFPSMRIQKRLFSRRVSKYSSPSFLLLNIPFIWPITLPVRIFLPSHIVLIVPVPAIPCHAFPIFSSYSFYISIQLLYPHFSQFFLCF